MPNTWPEGWSKPTSFGRFGWSTRGEEGALEIHGADECGGEAIGWFPSDADFCPYFPLAVLDALREYANAHKGEK